jgi:predicted ATPase
MKIDIHTHTKKIKAGDPPTRDIEPTRFAEIVKNTDVRIIAVTNHNHFDITQFRELSTSVEDICQLWPGVELDIQSNHKRGHLLVIANPRSTGEFHSRVSDIIADSDPDSFVTSLERVVELFGALDCIYIAHYQSKKPSIDDEDLDRLATLVSNPKRILKEASNSISAGIYISHGHNSIYGSDVKDWNSYSEDAKNLPELRLPVESFEQFALLLEKDEATINTLLDKKVKEPVELVLFNVAEKVLIDIYNDINILFGSKGTGKTTILDALSKNYNSRGHITSVYKSNDIHVNEAFDLAGKDFTLDLAALGVDDCTSEIKFIRETSEKEVTSLQKYLQHFSLNETNKIAQKLKIKEIPKADESQPARKLKEITSINSKFKEFSQFISTNTGLQEILGKELWDDLSSVFQRALDRLLNATENQYFESSAAKLLNFTVELIKTEIAKKTGQPQKPSKTGFLEYGSNRIRIEKALQMILNNLNKVIPSTNTYAGSLSSKGELHVCTNIQIQHGAFTNTAYKALKSTVGKKAQKELANAIRLVQKNVYSAELFTRIATLNEKEGIDSFSGISDLMLFHRHFTLNGEPYEPSNGESSMILLHRELLEDKEIYLIDEPEKSLGNDYINDVIVPLLKEKASLRKKVIIATHDANIAVRTLPYNSIYRLHDQKQYFTLTGNPFSNKLRCIYDSRPELDWKEVSMRTLEGGKAAFGERGKIYGNN